MHVGEAGPRNEDLLHTWPVLDVSCIFSYVGQETLLLVVCVEREGPAFNQTPEVMMGTTQASSSLSRVLYEYLASAVLSFLEKKARGCQPAPHLCYSTHPRGGH